MRRGRKLTIVARRGPSGPILVAATLAACGADVTVQEQPTGGSPATTTTTSGGGEGGGIFPVGGSAGGPGGAPICDPGQEHTFEVSIPPEGVPATPGEICSVVMGPVESNNAARVTLLKDPANLQLASGEVTIAPALLADVVGPPSIEVVSSPVPELMQMVVSNVAPTSTGFSFDASWPSPLPPEPDENTMMIVRTTFELACPPNQTQEVEAHTHVNLCDTAGDVVWVSSGDECTICGIIAEMAPSPIVPDRVGDEIGLGRVIRLRLVIVARIGDALLVLAEHDGGADLDYEWVASGGELVRVARDLVLWTPEGTQVLQVAVMNDDAAAVASYSSVPVRDAGMVA